MRAYACLSIAMRMPVRMFMHRPDDWAGGDWAQRVLRVQSLQSSLCAVWSEIDSPSCPAPIEARPPLGDARQGRIHGGMLAPGCLAADRATADVAQGDPTSRKISNRHWSAPFEHNEPEFVHDESGEDSRQSAKAYFWRREAEQGAKRDELRAMRAG